MFDPRLQYAPPLLAVPAGFDPEQALPARLRSRADDARWFLHTIAVKTAYEQLDDWGYVRLDSRILRRVMSKRAQPAVVRALVDAKVIDPPAPYFAGVKAKGYRLTEKTLQQHCRLVELRDRQLIKRLERERERLQREESIRWLPIHRQLAESQRSMTILPAADAILDGLAPAAQLCQRILTEDIRRAELKFSVCGTGRCFNGLTGLKRELRKTIRLEGEAIGGADIRCAQPALLAGLMRLGNRQNVPTYMSTFILPPPPPTGPDRTAAAAADFAMFESAALSGTLYDRLVVDSRSAGVVLPDDPHDAREKVKLLLMRDVLAKRGRYPSAFENVFQQTFPTVHGFIRRVNGENHGKLIRALQRLESWLVIENVAPRLVGRFPIVTLHDAIYSRTADLPTVVDAFAETFDELGLQMGVKTESAGSAKENYRRALDRNADM